MLGGWERYGQATAYPDVFPPAEGWDGLKYLVDTLHKMRYKVGFFVMGSFLSRAGPLGDTKRLKHIIRKWTGEPYSDSDFVFLDPASEYWKTNLINISVELVKNTGVDLLYYDTVPHTPVNYDVKSGHSVGGGNYSSTAWIEIFREIKKRTRNLKPDLAIITEGSSEFLIPYVSGFYSGIGLLSPSNSTPVNVVKFIYPDIVQMGWWVALREQYQYSLYESREYHGRSVVDDTASYLVVSNLFLSGDPISLGGFHIGGFTGESFEYLLYDDKLSFYEELAYARSTYLNEFLVQGEKIKDFEYGEQIELRCPRGELEGDTENGCRVLHVSPIQGAVWKSPEGDTAAIMINFWNRPVDVNITSVFSSPDVLLINGLPYSIPRNGIVTLNPHGLMVLFSLKDKSRLKSYEMKIRDSLKRHLIEFERHMELSQINYPWIEVLSLKRSLNQNLSLSQLIEISSRINSLKYRVYKYGTVTSDELLVEIEYAGLLDSFAVVNFNVPIVWYAPPMFREGNGVLYVSRRPMYIGYPHWNMRDELLGYNVVLFPPYTWEDFKIKKNIADVRLRLAVNPESDSVVVKVSAGEFWHEKPWIHVRIFDRTKNILLLDITQLGGGWRSYVIPTSMLYENGEPMSVEFSDHVNLSSNSLWLK